MHGKLRILILEDRPSDAELMLREVRRAGYEPEWTRVETEADYLAMLDQSWEIILADYNLPRFTGLRALELLNARGLDIPLVIVSGTIGEDKAVAAMKAGARDYVMKDKLAKLGPTIERELRDALERRKFERTQAELSKLSLAVAASHEVVFMTDLAGAFTFVNPAFTRLYGYTATEIVGKATPRILKSGVVSQETYESFWKAILNKQVVTTEIINKAKGGTLLTIETAVNPILDAQGESIGFLAIQHDITAEKHLQAQYLQAQKMESVGRLAGGVAHDFNNLLTVILGTVDLALANRQAEDPVYAELQEVRRAGELAAGLTRQLLAFSRKQILQPKVLSLNQFLPDMLSMMHRLLGEDIQIVFVPGEDVGPVKVDPGQIEQVVVNLAVNARDAMPAGGTLSIETQGVVLDQPFAAAHPPLRPGPHVMLTVRDTGCGMDEATRLQVFEPFFTTKGPGKGTGLGLSTVYGIVEQSGGSIGVESEVGRGSSFRIYLPRAEGTAPTSTTVPAGVASGGSETILVVEDDGALRRLAKRFLEPAGYEVLAAATGEEALQLLARRDGSVHLMVTDVVMPGMSGLELAHRVSALYPALDVILTSGYTDDAIVQHGPLPEGTHFLSKPYTVTGLRRTVREVLDSRGGRPTTG